MLNTIYILWLRQLRRYFRSGLRIVISVVQPLLYLLVFGYGFNSIFMQAGQGSYVQFIVPGIVVQTIMFTSMFWGANIIWDKQFGFLKETLVAPVPRTIIMLGSAVGGVTIALIQGSILFFLALLFGFHPYSWAMTIPAFFMCTLLAFAMVGFSAGIAAIVNDMQGFMALNNFLLLPLFFLSGALFPLDHVPGAMKVIAMLNPLSYAVDAIRGSLLGQSHFSFSLDMAVLTGIAVVLFSFGAYRFKRIVA